MLPPHQWPKIFLGAAKLPIKEIDIHRLAITSKFFGEFLPYCQEINHSA